MVIAKESLLQKFYHIEKCKSIHGKIGNMSVAQYLLYRYIYINMEVEKCQIFQKLII